MSSAHWREGLLLKVVNVATYPLLGLFIYTMILKQSIYDVKQTYFTPSTWAFLAWPIIYLLLFGTVIYQFTSAHAKKVVVNGISWGFPLLAIVNVVFVIVWADHSHSTIAFILSLLLAYTSGTICWILRAEHPSRSAGDALFVYLPFSTWHAWNTVLCFLTAFEAFGIDATEEQAGFWTNFLVFFALSILESAATTCALSIAPTDSPAAFVFSWTLWAIYDHNHTTDFIHASALFFSILSLIWVLMAMDGVFRQCTGRRHSLFVDEERGPLLGHQ